MTSDDIMTLSISSIVKKQTPFQACHWSSTIPTYFCFEELTPDAYAIRVKSLSVLIHQSLSGLEINGNPLTNG